MIISKYRRHAACCVRPIAAAAALAMTFAAIPLATAANTHASWKNVHISSGSGFVTDIIAQPKVPNLFYLRTDVGGFFRWNPTRKEWIPISDFITVQHRDLYGGESIAVDPENANTVYIACGGGQEGAIFKSTDRGNIWTELGLKGVMMSGNAWMRWGGERLQIQPGSSKLMLFGSRTQGLWSTNDGGATWKQTSLPFPAKDTDGVQAVAFDPNMPTTIYAAVATEGIFKSTDDGNTWTNISTSITKPERLTVAQDSTVWVTYNNGVSKFAESAWSNVTPKGATTNAYCGLAVNPRNANKVIVSYGLWRDTAPTGMFMTGDGGATWTRLKDTVTTDVPWYVKLSPGKRPGTITDFLYTPISNFMFDAHNPSSVWFASAGGIYNTTNINRPGGPLFHHVENGHEELCFCALSAPPTGNELIAGAGDVNGFVFDKGLDTYPSQNFDMNGSRTGITTNLTYEERNPQNMAAMRPMDPLSVIVFTSSDGGFHWTQDKSFPRATAGKKPLTPIAITMSSSNPDDVVAAVCNSDDHKDRWLYKTSATSGWKECSGLADQSYSQWSTIPIAADPLDGRTFYVYCAGKIYRSTDGGATFNQMSAGTVGATGVAAFFKLVAQPGKTGDLWLSEDQDNSNYLSPIRPSWEGLYHSSDAGRTWARVPGVTRAVVFAFGKASSSGHPTLYYYGRRSGDDTDRVFQSTDLGKSWLVISRSGQAMGDNPYLMEASRQTFGRVFIGTGGRGIYYTNAAGR
jgi:xyloglucan-specific exo-beta-1,4-glucanase